MRIVSWNVNGLRAAWSHGVSSVISGLDADIYLFQETKVSEPFGEIRSEVYHDFWSFGSKKGYSGTLVLSKEKPLDVTYDLGDKGFHDTEGRIITLEYGGFFVVDCYMPNTAGSDKRKDFRELWDEKFYGYLHNLERVKPVIVCGDFNTTVSDDEIYEGSSKTEKELGGFQSFQRDNLLKFIDSGFVDGYRYKHPDERGKFSWWSNRLNKRTENKGWRLDYCLVSEKLSEKILDCDMMTGQMGSDHCPVVLDIDLADFMEQRIETKRPRKCRLTYADLKEMEKHHGPLKYTDRGDMSDVWASIDWEAAEANLKAMQMTLAKIAYSGDIDGITAYQKKIVYSIDAKLLAVRYVCSSSPGSGVDGITWKTPHEKMCAALSLDSLGYSARPSRLVVVKSKKGRDRHIHMETYYDRAMQVLYAFSLDPVSEAWGDRYSFSCRKGRSLFDADSYIKETFSGEDAPQWGFRGDIKGCYESIAHRWMLRHIPMAEKVLREFLQAGYVFNGQMFPTDQGIGLGCTLSPIIANMTLNGLQEHIYRSLGEDPKKNYPNGRIIRYSDDFIVAANDERTAKQIRYIVEEFLKDRGLVLSEEKSHVFNVKDSFTFLSRIYMKSEGKLYSNPSDDAIGRFMDRLKELIDGYKGSQQQLIADINKRIDGWATYHKTNDTGTDVVFRQMDTYITGMLLTLCKKKHPTWDDKKIIERYWYKDYDDQYYYSLPDKREVRVKHLSDTLFVDYKPVNVRMNPYTNPEYFERRTQDRAVQSAAGIFRTVWDRQDGRCYYCGKKILRDEVKAVVQIDPGANRRKASAYAYAHERCTLCSVEYAESDEAISSISDIMDLLYSIKNEGAEKKTNYKYDSLREYFFSTDKLSFLLSFKDIEKISGTTLPKSASEDTFWYRGGPGAISRCWTDAGYEIKNLHTKERPRILFVKSESAKKNEYIIIPKELVNNRIPKKAKYEMENYFKYIIKKYAL